MKCEKFYNVINQTDVPYAQIPNELLRDQNLSIEARGLLALMLSHNVEVWDYKAVNLATVSGMGKTKYQKTMRELETNGYILRKVVRNEETGKIIGRTILLSNKSGTYTVSSKNRQTVKPADGKTVTKNTKKLKKTNFKENTLSSENRKENLNQNQSQNTSAGKKSKTGLYVHESKAGNLIVFYGKTPLFDIKSDQAIDQIAGIAGVSTEGCMSYDQLRKRIEHETIRKYDSEGNQNG